MGDLRISQLAERSGVPATTLRFYETVGLLPADRTPAGYRIYDEDSVERLEFIGAAKQLGLPLEEIAELVQVWAQGSCAEVRADLRPRLSARIAQAQQRAAELSAFTETLHRAAKHLDSLPDRDERCDPQCGFLTLRTASSTLPVEVHRTRDQAWRTAPVACSLTGPDVRERVKEWRTALEGAVREPIAGGLRLSLPADRAGRIADLAVAEQGCCAFFDFRLQLAGSLLHLEVRAPAEAGPFLDDLFNPASSQHP